MLKKPPKNSGWALVNGGVVILNIWDIDEAMHGLYQTKQISKERKIYNSKANFRCLLANKCNHYTYLSGGREGFVGLFSSTSSPPFPASCLSPPFWKQRTFYPGKMSIFFFKFFLSSPAHLLPAPYPPLSPCQALIFSTDQENNKLCLSYCLYDKPYLLVYFFIIWLWI